MMGADASGSPPDLVIFDCDGVLVDSMGLSDRVLVEALRDAGMHISVDEVANLLRGGAMHTWPAALEEHFDQPLPEGFLDAFVERRARVFACELVAIEGVAEALDRLHVPYCVATNGPMNKVTQTLTVTGLIDRFEGRIFSAYDIGSWKPEPDLFLHAAERMGAPPSRCVVVEDAPIGVQAARAAGMPVLGYAADERAAAELADTGATVFRTMRDLPMFVGRRDR